MTEANRVSPQYQSVVQGAAAESDTQQQLAQMRSGERWSLTATERAYNAGGNQNGTMQEGSPQQQQPQ